MVDILANESIVGASVKQASRLAAFIALVIGLIAIFAIYNGDVTSGETTANTVIFSALLMLSFGTLLLEHWFTKPTDAIASAIGVLLTILPSREGLANMGGYLTALAVYCTLVLLCAAIAITLATHDGPSAKQQRISEYFKHMATRLGSSKLLFSLLFFTCLVSYSNNQNSAFVPLMAYAGLVLIIDPKRLPSTIWRPDKGTDPIGEIIGVQSRNTILAKLKPNRPPVRRYDFVEFADAGNDGQSRKGLIIDNWVLNSEQWIKIFSGRSVDDALGAQQINSKLKAGQIYLIKPQDADQILDRFVGTVYEGSDILSVRFDYGMRTPITDGTLLQIPIGNANVLYQVTQGVTRTEKLDAKNEAGLIIGHASQIGTWNPATLSFDRFGWVPEINKPVLLAENIAPVAIPENEISVGNIPNTNYPVLMNKRAAINCHMAVLGVTGTGKSVFTRNLLRTFSADGIKIIAVDFTGEYRAKLADTNPVTVMEAAEARPVFDNIDWIAAEKTKFANQQNVELIAQNEREVGDAFRVAIRRFIADEPSIAIFELPDVSNSNSILSYTRWFFKILFEIAREGELGGEQVCVVLEEAHTVVPEWNFLSTEDKGAQALLNQIAQIALQGRKYGIGFMVIAQRTANVSKTVLTQCNTIIAFQQFDKTSSDFLANYMGTGMSEALQNLRPRQAIAVGKAFRSGLPAIFQVPEIQEPEAQTRE